MKSRKRNRKYRADFNGTNICDGHVGREAAPSRKLRRGDVFKSRCEIGKRARKLRKPICLSPVHDSSRRDRSGQYIPVKEVA